MTGEVKQQNAIITGATLTTEDHGVLSIWISMDLEFGCQSFGGHVLFLPKEFKHAPKQANFAGLWIFRVMQVAGVSEWSKLTGKTVRVRGTWDGITAIGHITKDDWFCPKDEFAAIAEDGVEP